MLLGISVVGVVLALGVFVGRELACSPNTFAGTIEPLPGFARQGLNTPCGASKLRLTDWKTRTSLRHACPIPEEFRNRSLAA